MVKRSSEVRIFSISINEKNLEINYPQLQIIKNNRHRTKINELIRNMVDSFIKEEIQEEGQENISVGYEIKLNRSNLLSILFKISNFTKEQNEIFTTFRSITINTKNAALLSLKDLFIENSYYEYVINKIISDYIENNQTPYIQEFLNKDINKFFYLTEKYLVIYFPLNRGTNYAYFYCVPEYFIPFNNIKGFLNPNSSISRFSKA